MKKMENNSKVLVFVRYAYQETDGNYVYYLYFSDTPDNVWRPQWDVINPSTNGDISPDESTYSEVYEIRTEYKLKTLEETSCYSMEYAIYGILALSWIDLEGLEDYPENGRMTLHFGDSLDEVKALLDKFDIVIEEKKKENESEE